MSTETQQPHRGRFAPSPTGPLHFGSLVAAVGSYLDARHHHGEWLLRVEDIDPPREVAGATDAILHSLEAFGLQWDGAVIYQSHRGDHYEAALEILRQHGMLYGCACTRKEIADSAIHTDTGAVYPGTCRNGIPAGRTPRSLRVPVDNAEITLHDRLQGSLHQSLSGECGDFVVRRADRLIAYQLAVVVDDAAQRITHVVRGTDLLDSTPRQVHLQQLLDFPTPDYMHLPVAANRAGEKLGKQTYARRIDDEACVASLCDVLSFLQQALPDEPLQASRDELLQWAIAHWDITAIPGCRSLTAPADYLENTAKP